jgi:hypothetical protein
VLLHCAREIDIVQTLTRRARGLGLWCLTPLSTIFQLYHGGQVYWWRKVVYMEKTTEQEEEVLTNVKMNCIALNSFLSVRR